MPEFTVKMVRALCYWFPVVVYEQETRAQTFLLCFQFLLCVFVLFGLVFDDIYHRCLATIVSSASPEPGKIHINFFNTWGCLSNSYFLALLDSILYRCLLTLKILLHCDLWATDENHNKFGKFKHANWQVSYWYAVAFNHSLCGYVLYFSKQLHVCVFVFILFFLSSLFFWCWIF